MVPSGLEEPRWKKQSFSIGTGASVHGGMAAGARVAQQWNKDESERANII